MSGIVTLDRYPRDLVRLADRAAEHAARPAEGRSRRHVFEPTSDVVWWAVRLPALVSIALAVRVLAEFAGTVLS